MKDDSTVGGRAALVEAAERTEAAWREADEADKRACALHNTTGTMESLTAAHRAIDTARELRPAMHAAREALQAWDREHAAALDLDAIEARANAATRGPWRECLAEQGGCQCCTIWSTPDDIPVADTRTAIAYEGKVAPESAMRNDARFIAASRSDVPALCAEVRRLRARGGECAGYRIDPDDLSEQIGDITASARWLLDEFKDGSPTAKLVRTVCKGARWLIAEVHGLRARIDDTRQATHDATALGVQFEGVADKLSDIGDRQAAEIQRLRRLLTRAEEWIRSGAEKIEMLDDDPDGACANARAFADELRAAVLADIVGPAHGSGIPSRGETARCGPGPGVSPYQADTERGKCLMRAYFARQAAERSDA